MVPFRSYARIGENRYRESFGLDFEQFEAGQVFHHRPGVTVSQQDNVEEALDTINNAQLHYDAQYASQTEWEKCLGVSTMTLQKLIGMASKTFYRKLGIVEFADIAMTNPVFGGDTLYAVSEIKSKEDFPENSDVGMLTVVTRGVNQHGKEVANVEYRILVYRAGKHPLSGDEPAGGLGVESAKFASHRLMSDGSFMEQTGIFFEDLMPGEVYEHRPGKTFTEEENRLHALRSLDLCPQYSDSNYTARYTGNKVLIVEPFLVGAVTALTTRTFGRVVANLGWTNVRLIKPVYAGDTIYATSEILDKRESASRPAQGIMHVKSSAHNQKGELVCTYERKFLIYKKGMGPYENSGY